MKPTGVMRSSQGRILFVEDERSLVDMYHDYLISKGYDFLSTADIKEALIVTEFEMPDAVLLDIIIPKDENGTVNLIAEQGYDYLAAAKANPKIKDIPIIVFTNLDTDKDREKSRAMGAAAYIFKRDSTPQEVTETIAKVIAAHKAKMVAKAKV